MGRITNEQEYAIKRKEILEVARGLVFTRGYEQMAIQDILDELRMSKGAFYHYFASKQALLEALVDSMRLEAEQILLPIVQDNHLAALEKLGRFFNTISLWKTEQKDFLLGLLRAWYSDENAIVRQKMQVLAIQWYAPMLTSIIQQGIREGTLGTAHPDLAGEMALHLLLGMGDAMSGVLLSSEAAQVAQSQLQHTLAAYTDALERLLGAPAGSLKIMEPETLEAWVVSST